MVLTKMALDTTRRQVMLALQTPSIFHGLIEHAFPGERVRKLWRIDRVNGEHALLLLSDEAPALEAACEEMGFPEKRWVSRDYEDLLQRVENNSTWRFRLVANPTYAKKGNAAEGKRGQVCAHKTTAHQREWLKEQATRYGFALNDDGFDVTSVKWYRFDKHGTRYPANRYSVAFMAVAYEGTLQVTDATLLRTALLEGIGREKAYGMGLLTLLPIQGNG